ncbi:MAG: kelch repeat-containing protein, partial [Solirubrobacterales bacterium]|nr:kelch repeat-containing protein [Solirubrobacterales bacterium]
VLPSGKVLIAGGLDGSGYLASGELYNPATGLFTTTGSLTTGRAYATASVLPSGKVLIAGGEGNSGYLASAELYTPTPSKPGKPAVKWALNKKKRLVTATVNLVAGTTYKLTAKLGRKTKSGKCKTKGAKVTCTLAPGKGKWTFAITPHNSAGNGTVNGKALKL